VTELIREDQRSLLRSLASYFLCPSPAWWF
jgi:hypothetical protein